MASIIDSFREVVKDRFSLPKLFILALPVYFSYLIFLQSKNDFTVFYWSIGITVFILFGFLIKLINNVINAHSSCLILLNPLGIILASIKGIVAVGPVCLISCWLGNYLTSLINLVSWFGLTIKIVIWLVFAVFILTSFLMFCENENIKDAYKVKVVFGYAGDLIGVFAFFLFLLVFLNVLTIGFIGYVLFLLLGQGVIFNFFIAMAIVFNLAVSGHYLGQIQYEFLACNQNKKN